MDYGLWILTIIISLVVIGAYWGMKALWGFNYIRCPNCNYVGKKSVGISGSFTIELILWIAGFIGLFFFLIPGLILLLIALLYSLSRKRFIKCPACDWKNPVKMDYDAYKKILALRAKGQDNQPAV